MTISNEAYRRYTLRARYAGNYFLFFRPYLKILPKLTALFLQDLINISSGKSVIHEEVNGKDFFMCTEEFLENSYTKWSSDEQTYHFRVLRGLGSKGKEPKDGAPIFVAIIRRGIPGVRWIHIDYLGIDKVLDKVEEETTGESPGNPPDYLPEKPGNYSPRKPGHNKVTTNVVTNKGITNCRASGDDGDLVVPEGFGSTDENNESPAQKLATQLYTVINRHGKVMRKVNLSKWTLPFTELLKHRTFDQITEVINYHDKYLNDRFWPQHYSAKSFCDEENFLKMEDNIRRRNEAGSVNNKPNIVISPKAADLAAELTEHYYWPKGSSEQLPAAIEQSLSFFTDFRTSGLKKAMKDKKLRQLANHLNEALESPVSFVEDWYVRLNARYNGWEDWHGKVDILSYKNTKFRNYGRELSDKYSGNPDEWDSLVEFIQQRES